MPELWRYNGRRLQINLLQDGKYIESLTSPNFPGLPLAAKIPQFIERIARQSPFSEKRNGEG